MGQIQLWIKEKIQRIETEITTNLFLEVSGQGQTLVTTQISVHHTLHSCAHQVLPDALLCVSVYFVMNHVKQTTEGTV